MKKLKIIRVIPRQAGEKTSTPGRKFLQVIFAPVAEGNSLNTQRDASKNVWEGFKGKNTITGGDLNIKADPLFISIMEKVGRLPEDYKWSDVPQGTNGLFETPQAFRGVVGATVSGDIITHYVEPYEIPTSQSADATRYQYTAVVLEGENEFQVFAQQNHPIVQDEDRLSEIKSQAAGTAQVNNDAKEERRLERGLPPSFSRTGTGALANTQRSNVIDEASEAMSPKV